MFRRYWRRSKIFTFQNLIILGVILTIFYISSLKIKREIPIPARFESQEKVRQDYDENLVNQEDLLLEERKIVNDEPILEKDDEPRIVNDDEFEVWNLLRKLWKGQESFIFRTNTFPKNEKLFPFLSNGNIGYRVYGNVAYVNGLYAGRGNMSHRMWIPNYSNLRIYYCEYNKKLSDSCEWAMNIRDGIFMEHIKNEKFELFHVTYAHRKYPFMMVNQVFMKRLPGNKEKISVNFLHSTGWEEDDTGKRLNPMDIVFKEEKVRETDFGDTITVKIGEAYEVDKSPFSVEEDIKIMYNQIPQQLVLKPNEKYVAEKYLMSISNTMDSSVNFHFDELLYMPNDEMLKEHTEEWNNFWETEAPSVFATNNERLTSVIQSTIFTLASSISSKLLLSYVNPLSADSRGHLTSDTEIWIANAMNFINTNYSRKILSRRFIQQHLAKKYAEETGFKGVRFPTETDKLGMELSSFKNKLHTTGDVSFAVRQFYAMTRNNEWMKGVGCPLSQEIARFWASVAQFNEKTGYYEIKNVTGPDSRTTGVDNDLYTNVIAGYSLFFGRFTDCLCSKISKNYQSDESEAKMFDHIGSHLLLPFDKKEKIYLKNSNFNVENVTFFDMPDVMMLNYPLNYKIPPVVFKNIDQLYTPLVDLGIAPTLSYVVNAMSLISRGRIFDANDDFKNSHLEAASPPFYSWHGMNVENYLMNAGAFLQMVFNGYAGIRPQIDSMLIKGSNRLPFAGKTEYKNLTYLESKFTIVVTKKDATVQFSSIGRKLQMKQIGTNKKFEDIVERKKYEIPKQGLKIKLNDDELFKCKLPLEEIGLRVGHENDPKSVEKFVIGPLRRGFQMPEPEKKVEETKKEEKKENKEKPKDEKEKLKADPIPKKEEKPIENDAKEIPEEEFKADPIPEPNEVIEKEAMNEKPKIENIPIQHSKEEIKPDPIPEPIEFPENEKLNEKLKENDQQGNPEEEINADPIPNPFENEILEKPNKESINEKPSIDEVNEKSKEVIQNIDTNNFEDPKQLSENEKQNEEMNPDDNTPIFPIEIDNNQLTK